MVPLRSVGRDWISGSLATKEVPSLNTITVIGSDKPARTATIFIYNGAPRALVGWIANRDKT